MIRPLRGITAAVFVFALTVAVACSMSPSVALADTPEELQAKLDDAKAQIADLDQQIMAAEAQLGETQDALDSTNEQITTLTADIDAKQSQLDEAQQTLSSRVSDSYKAGSTSLLDIVLDSSNFDELVTRIHYAEKANEADAKAIQEVRDLKVELEAQQQQLQEQKAEQEQLLSQQQADADQLSSRQAELTSYADSLDAQVQQALAAEKAAQEEANRQAAAAAQQQAQQNGGNYYQGSEQGSGNDGGSGAANSNGSGSNSGSSSWQGSLTDEQRSIILATAWDRVNAGCSYVSGTGGPNTFGCAGFTQYCYGKAGIYLPRSPAAQEAMVKKVSSTSELKPGDLVFWNNHVAIWAGDGGILEAASPSQGVRYFPFIYKNIPYHGAGYLA